jgi:formylglycine-generating enzyme required for sulfatase activity
MAPEQAQGKGIDARCDLFSLGCVLYRLATGAAPFKGTDMISTLMAVATENPPPPHELDGTLPRALSALTMTLLAKNPKDRPESAQAVAAALDDVAGRRPGPPPAALPATKSKRPLMVAAACVLVGLIGLWSAGVLKVKTKDGTIVLENLPADAEVLIDGAAVTLTTRDGRTAEIRVAAAKNHQLQVKTNGFKVFGKEVEVEAGGRTAPITVRLEPLPAKDLPQAERPRPRPVRWPFDEQQAKALQKAWADYLGVPVETSIDLGGGEKLEMVLVPPGTFFMGAPQAELDDVAKRRNAKPQGFAHELGHEVTLTKPFYLGKCEVTQAQYERVMGRNPSRFTKDKGGGPDHPVENLSWFDARDFCDRLSALPAEKAAGRVHRLPTEAEWEYACRAGASGAYGGGGAEEELRRSGWYGGNSGGCTRPVGKLAPNAWGLFDMHGNVWEWCRDWFGWDYYRKDDKTDPQGPVSSTNGPSRVVRGGSWSSNFSECRAASRGWWGAASRLDRHGCRVSFHPQDATSSR